MSGNGLQPLWRFARPLLATAANVALVEPGTIYGDRLYALHSTGAPVGFPFLMTNTM